MWPSFYVLDHRGIIRYEWTDSPAQRRSTRPSTSSLRGGPGRREEGPVTSTIERGRERVGVFTLAHEPRARWPLRSDDSNGTSLMRN